MASHPGIVHEALLYRDTDGLVEGVRAFLAPGLAAGAHTMVAVPGDHVRVLREGLGDAASAVRFEDMRKLGRNPGRVIPALHDWLCCRLRSARTSSRSRPTSARCAAPSPAVPARPAS